MIINGSWDVHARGRIGIIICDPVERVQRAIQAPTEAMDPFHAETRALLLGLQFIHPH
jgi:Reverse transcriptase-like